MNATVNAAVGRLVVLGTATIGGLGLAIYSGRAVAQGNYNSVMMIVAAILGLCIFLGIGKNAYIFLAMSVGLTGSIGALPLPFSYQELMIFGCTGITFAHIAFKRLKVETRGIYLDLFVIANLLYLASVYIRNPVGVRAFGSEMVGGRPYLVVIVSALFYFAIVQYKIPPKLAPKFPFVIAGPIIFFACIQLLAYFVPGVTKVVYPFWNGVGLDKSIIEAAGGTVSGGDALVSRIPGSGIIGMTVIQLLCAYFPVGHFISPMCPLPFFLFSLAMIGWLASGFRSGILVYAGYLFYNCWLRRRLNDLVPLIPIAVIFLGILVVGQGTMFDLPKGMQRSLSFLPGNWNVEAKGDADASTEWRLEMWKEVWGNKEFIKSKTFGDGFGFSSYDLKLQIDAILGQGGYMDGTKAQMITGAYHSGPLSGIRYVGVVGTLLFLALQIAVFVYSAGLVRRAWGTPYQAISLFIAVPLFYSTFSYYTIFGGYETELPRTIFTVGLLKLVELSLRDYKKSLADAEARPPVPLTLPRPQLTRA